MSNSSGLKIELTVRDDSWKRLDTFKCNAAEFHKISSILYKKYGIFSIKKKNKDLDWLKKADW